MKSTLTVTELAEGLFEISGFNSASALTPGGWVVPPTPLVIRVTAEPCEAPVGVDVETLLAICAKVKGSEVAAPVAPTPEAPVKGRGKGKKKEPVVETPVVPVVETPATPEVPEEETEDPETEPEVDDDDDVLTDSTDGKEGE